MSRIINHVSDLLIILAYVLGVFFCIKIICILIDKCTSLYDDKFFSLMINFLKD